MKRSGCTRNLPGRSSTEERPDQQLPKRHRHEPIPCPPTRYIYPCECLDDVMRFLTGTGGGVTLSDYEAMCRKSGERLPDYHFVQRTGVNLVEVLQNGTVSHGIVCRAIQEITLRVAYIHHRLLPSGKERDFNHSLTNAYLYDYINLAGYTHILPSKVRSECLQNKALVEEAESSRYAGIYDEWCQLWCDPVWRSQQLQQIQVGCQVQVARSRVSYDDL